MIMIVMIIAIRLGACVNPTPDIYIYIHIFGIILCHIRLTCNILYSIMYVYMYIYIYIYICVYTCITVLIATHHSRHAYRLGAYVNQD